MSLPTTAYIKMNDIWMLFTMLYPFMHVALYAAKEVLKEKRDNITNSNNSMRLSV